MSLYEYKLKNLGDKIREQAEKVVEVKQVEDVEVKEEVKKVEVKKRRLNK